MNAGLERKPLGLRNRSGVAPVDIHLREFMVRIDLHLTIVRGHVVGRVRIRVTVPRGERIKERIKTLDNDDPSPSLRRARGSRPEKKSPNQRYCQRIRKTSHCSKHGLSFSLLLPINTLPPKISFSTSLGTRTLHWTSLLLFLNLESLKQPSCCPALYPLPTNNLCRTRTRLF